MEFEFLMILLFRGQVPGNDESPPEVQQLSLNILKTAAIITKNAYKYDVKYY